MKTASVVLRSILFHAAAVVTAIPLLPGFPLQFVAPRRVTWPIVVAWLRLVSRLLRIVCRIDHRVEGAEHLPAGPCLLASRHESAWEVFFFPLIFDDPVAFAKQEIFGYPIGGRIVRGGGHISIRRDGDLEGVRSAFERAREAVTAGRSVLIFPSGTRHESGRDRIQNGVAALYELLDVPCVPITLDSGRCCPPGSWLMYPGTIHVRIGPPIAPGLDKRAFLDVLKQRLAIPGAGEGI